MHHVLCTGAQLQAVFTTVKRLIGVIRCQLVEGINVMVHGSADGRTEHCDDLYSSTINIEL